MGLRDQFLAGIARRQAMHTLPDGTTIPIRELVADEYFQAVDAGGFDREAKTWANIRQFYAVIVRHGVCDEQGMPLFTDDDIPALTHARGWVNEESWTQSVADAIWALSGVRQADFSGGDPAPDDAGSAADAGTGEA